MAPFSVCAANADLSAPDETPYFFASLYRYKAKKTDTPFPEYLFKTDYHFNFLLSAYISQLCLPRLPRRIARKDTLLYPA